MSPRKVVDGRQVNVKLEEYVLRGLEALAEQDNRSGRDYIRVTLKRHVEAELKKRTITLEETKE